MALFLFALAAAMPVPHIGDGDAIVALAWERRRKETENPAIQCVRLDAQSMADRIRQPDRMLGLSIAKDDTNQRPDPARLRRIARGEGQTAAVDLKRLGLPAPSPACKYRYSVNAPVVLGNYAYVHVGMDCDGLCGGGEVLVLERRDATWRIVAPLVQWAS
jgi:hypothetical protein